MISIILPSYLGDYPQSATDKEAKLHRSIQSVLAQTFTDYELIVVSDGCEKTIKIAEQYDLNLFGIDKQPLMSGTPRNIGIEQATQDWICYIDSDDVWGKDHLTGIVDKMCCNYKWFWFNDWIYVNEQWVERLCKIKIKGMCGTSNIIHKRNLAVKWGDGYLHDYLFIRDMWKYDNKRIDAGEYFVMHIPSKYDI